MDRLGIVVYLGIVLCIHCSYSLSTLHLNGEWTLTNSNKSYTIPGQVPGSMYTALMASNVIGDPYYRKNDGAYRWVAMENWTYTRTFTVDPALLQQDSVVLVCEGLDTVATVSINNQTVGSSDNMFVRYVFDIKTQLVTGSNEIQIRFVSAVTYGRAQAQAYPYWVLPGFTLPTQHGENHVNMIRKEQCSFSWDWAPSFPTQGIWKEIYIQGYSTAAIRYVTSEAKQNSDGSWKLIVEVFTEVKPGTTATGTMEAKLDGTSVARTVPVSLTSQNDKTTIEIDIPLSAAIKAWWPNGYGNQSLYDLYVFYTDQHGTMASEKVRIGFRTVELVEDYVSANKSHGKTFYFRINGRPIFFKGSNWIPADSFQERITRDYLRNLLQSAADVHMNALRVWGGGIYESDAFYELADELGIMLWQDFMFACSMYPTDATFLQSVGQEVTHQVRRMKHHPSIVVLSGNNENEKALVQDWYGTNVNYTRYKTDYVRLYRDVVYSIVQREDTSRPFLASSPSNGRKAPGEDWIAKEPWSTLYGDIHEYKYLVPFFDPSQYRIPRFGSEYGLQSFPSPESLDQVYEPTDMYYWGDLNEYRNHHPFGNIELMAEAIQYVNLPNSPNESQKFRDMIYVTQITQSIGVQTMTEHYRRWQNRLDKQGQGNTMGALYWMLEDIWQAPTWASLEYGGKWKMLHYFANRFFAPTLISPYLDGSVVDVYIIIDELPVKEVRHPMEHTLSFRPKSNPRPFNLFDWKTYYDGNGGAADSSATGSAAEFDGTLYIDMYKWSSMTPLHTWNVSFTMATTAQSVFREDYTSMMSTAGCVRTEACFLFFHFGDKANGPTSWLPLSQFVSADGLQKANAGVENVYPVPNTNQFIVTVTANAVAPFVWLDARGIKGRFSDNGFLQVVPKRNVTFYAWEQVTGGRLASAIITHSLMNIYHNV